MTERFTTPPLRWFHLVALLLCLIVGGGFRFHRITRESLWLDEYLAVYRATARDRPGETVFDLPFGVLIDPAPATGFGGTPHWWKIWTGLSGDMHPPVYYVVLRWWIDLFGDADLSTRSLSSLLDLASAIVLFEIVRRKQGPWQGVIAGGLLCFSCAHLDLSQETRSYTLLVFLGLLACRQIIFIEQKGATFWRLLWLGLFTCATALTHYLSAGALLGLGIYAFVRFRGRQRTKILATFAISLLVVAAAWGPFLWHARGILTRYDYLNLPSDQGAGHLISLLLSLPARLLLHPDLPLSFAVFAAAVLVYLLPIANLRRSQGVLFWWFWMMGTILFVAILDLARHTQMLSLARYTFLASPAMFALLASPLPIRGFQRWLIPVTVLFCSFCFALNRTMTGPSHTPQFREIAGDLAQLSGPNDVVVFTPSNQFFPQAAYLGVRHYLPDFPHPVVFLLRDPPDMESLQILGKQSHFWVLGLDAASQMPVYFPQWHADIARPLPPLMLWRVTPNSAPATSTEPSPATPR